MEVINQPKKKAISPTQNVVIPQEVNEDLSDSQASSSSFSSSEGHITEFTFESLDISTKTKKAISSVLQYKFMTAVQHQSMPSILEGERAVLLKTLFYALWLASGHYIRIIIAKSTVIC